MVVAVAVEAVTFAPVVGPLGAVAVVKLDAQPPHNLRAQHRRLRVELARRIPRRVVLDAHGASVRRDLRGAEDEPEGGVPAQVGARRRARRGLVKLRREGAVAVRFEQQLRAARVLPEVEGAVGSSLGEGRRGGRRGGGATRGGHGARLLELRLHVAAEDSSGDEREAHE